MKTMAIIIYWVFFLSMGFSVMAQNKVLELETDMYLTKDEITKLHEVVKEGPIPKMYANCYLDECSELNTYHMALYNLLLDIEEYQSYVELSAKTSKNIWESYVQTNIANEDLKSEIMYRLAFKDVLARLSSVLVDLTDIQNLAKTGALSGSKVEKMFKVLDIFDDIFSYGDVLVKTAKEDLDTNTMTEITGIPNFYTVYTNLKAHVDIVRETFTNIDKIKAWKSLGAANKWKAIRSPKVLNVGAAIANILGLWSNEERERMKKAISEYDELFKVNTEQQVAHYAKYNKKMDVVEQLDTVAETILMVLTATAELNRNCGNPNEKRYDRSIFQKDTRTFGKGARYYKNLLVSAIKTLPSSWSKIKACVEKPFEFSVFDGLGKKRSGYIQIFRASDNSKIHEGSLKLGKYLGKFSLFPDKYRIKVYEGYSEDNIRSIARVFDLTVNGDENEKHFKIKDYGRVSIEVLNEEGKAIPFRYRFYKKQMETVSYSFTENSKEQRFDVPANEPYKLEISYKEKTETVNGISIKPNQLNRLHFTYKEGQFIPVGSVESKLSVPNSYVVGMLYNSNDGSCDRYTQKTVVFQIRNQNIYNLKTGQFVEKVRILPGQKLKVAVPSDRGHFRALVLSEDQSENSIAFWYYDNMTKGWWFSAGCQNGTKPKERCYNGSIASSCGTLHEDY